MLDEERKKGADIELRTRTVTEKVRAIDDSCCMNVVIIAWPIVHNTDRD